MNGVSLVVIAFGVCLSARDIGDCLAVDRWAILRNADPANVDGTPSVRDDDRRVWRLRQLVDSISTNRADRLHVHRDDDVLHDDAIARTRHAL